MNFDLLTNDRLARLVGISFPHSRHYFHFEILKKNKNKNKKKDIFIKDTVDRIMSYYRPNKLVKLTFTFKSDVIHTILPMYIKDRLLAINNLASSKLFTD